MYHDVVGPDDVERSGFPGAGAAHYKLDPERFREHLDVLVGAGAKIVTLPELAGWSRERARSAPILLTFDDGGASAHDAAAPALEQRGLNGHFFIATDWLGKPGFLRPEQVLELARRGHVIGSHSASHPARIHQLPEPRIADEWRRSVAVLSEIVGAPIEVASVPGGYYSDAVARAAAEAGIKHLFTSEPQSSSWTVAGCEVYGRYAVTRRTSVQAVRGFATGAVRHVLPQWAAWQLKKLGKELAGRGYETLRSRLLSAEQRLRT
jgi:peptidoglycan/xylan/chitin deacetylase (PgdA/CDA1 family)